MVKLVQMVKLVVRVKLAQLVLLEKLVQMELLDQPEPKVLKALMERPVFLVLQDTMEPLV
jgi:hypothetical protein